ncbi:MAG TPA: DegT/DnrJ/EryC1/StrS family aminotransferase [Phycisphaerae bacterium]|nr:DegT/DnrJ/EryC1/StrS family aminotransferase [Phycisphaerae bacterium]
MLRVGQKELDAIAKVLLSGKIFRYGKLGGECGRFERRYARYLGVEHVWLASSGTTALTAALVGLGVGPGDEVIVPACTYMATPIAVLGAGAVPVIADVDDSITLDPQAVDAAVGPRTRAVVPVHMWGLPCDMNGILRVAKEHNLLVVEDACQGVGGGYEGRKLGSIGHAGAFSFNYYKNMTCGEGGAVVTNDAKAAERAGCMIDCCRFYWDGRDDGFRPFASNGSRASELEGAMLNAQLGRIDGLLRACRRQKRRILRETADTGLTPIRHHSPDHECGTHVMWTLPTAPQADEFAALLGGTVAGKTGRHVYTEWDPIFAHRGGPHPAMDPFKLAANRRCRKTYRKDMCRRSLDVLNRTVMVPTHPDCRRGDVSALIRKVRAAAGRVLR